MTAAASKRGQRSAPRPRGRANGEGSIYPYRNGYAAYVWVTTPTGEGARKYIYGQTREIVHDKCAQLQAKATEAPIPTSTPTVAQRRLEAGTYPYCEAMRRLYVSPVLGGKRLDRLQARDVQTWLNKLAKV